MNEFPYVRHRCSLQNIFGPDNIGLMNFAVMTDSKPKDASEMINGFNSRTGLFQRGRITNISTDDFNGIRKKTSRFLRTTGQNPDGMPC